MEYPRSTLSDLRTLVQTAVAREDAVMLTAIDAAINWATLLAAIVFKPTELNKVENLTITSGNTTVELTGLTRWMKVLDIYNSTDANNMWKVPMEMWDVILPTASLIKYYKIFGSTLTVNTAAVGNKVMRITFVAHPTKLSDGGDTLDFGGHDSFIVSAATGIVWAFLEEAESADIWKNVNQIVGGELMMETQERTLLEGQWRLVTNELQSGGLQTAGTSQSQSV